MINHRSGIRFNFRRPRFSPAATCLSFLSVLLLLLHFGDILSEEQNSSVAKTGGRSTIDRNRTVVRKLLATDNDEKPIGTPATAPSAAVRKERMGDDGCSNDDVAVYQGETPPLPNGIPTYTVEILNVCVSGCAVSDIHVSCGWFSSARLINPRVFRRVGFDDCLVNDGNALLPGGSLSFQYANTYRYPIYVSSLACRPL